MSDEPPFNLYQRNGALAYRSEDGTWNVVDPGDSLFSTISMVATHFYTTGVGWQTINDE